MTHLPKSELVGVLQPYSINTRDIGKNWTDLGVITSNSTFNSSYLGNGIVIIGDLSGNIWRSTDYGKTWTTVFAAAGILSTNSSSYLGNGIVIIGNTTGHIFRSTDFGINWTDLGIISTGIVTSSSYVGNGRALFSDNAGHIFRSTNFGATWTDLGVKSPTVIQTLSYLENQTVIFGDNNGHIFRSTNGGTVWTDLGVISPGIIRGASYLGNGIAIFSDNAGHVFRSIDFGATWTDLGLILTGPALSLSSIYAGNGIALIATSNGHIFRSDNFGLTWVDTATISVTSINTITYTDNGVIIAGGNDNHINRSDVSYKTNESQVNYPRIPVNQTALRALDSTFTNSDQTRSLMVMVTVRCTLTAANGTATLQLNADTASPPVTIVAGVIGFTGVGLNGESMQLQLVGIVQPGLNYRAVTVTANGTVTLNNWFEMYI